MTWHYIVHFTRITSSRLNIEQMTFNLWIWSVLLNVMVRSHSGHVWLVLNRQFTASVTVYLNCFKTGDFTTRTDTHNATYPTIHHTPTMQHTHNATIPQYSIPHNASYQHTHNATYPQCNIPTMQHSHSATIPQYSIPHNATYQHTHIATYPTMQHTHNATFPTLCNIPHNATFPTLCNIPPMQHTATMQYTYTMQQSHNATYPQYNKPTVKFTHNATYTHNAKWIDFYHLKLSSLNHKSNASF